MNDLISSSLQKLKLNNISNPDLDLRILLNHCSRKKNEIIFSNFDHQDINIKKFNTLLKRRLNYEPISKILNKKNFWKYDFYVNEDVIDPRPESEFIIEEVLKLINNKNKKINILDIGTGSGCLAVCLAKEYKFSKITAVDISFKAIKVAKKNFIIHGCADQIIGKTCDINKIKRSFDLIVSNPPYLSSLEYNKTSSEIKKFEPKSAFLGGNDGLLFYKKYSKILPKLMKSKSYLVLEIGEKQAKNCINILSSANLRFVKKVKDFQKKDRILVFYKL
tara:strand:- start:2992 stop:3822 length:831 start_codon:yes stop_codon:yes gene_type:complete